MASGACFFLPQNHRQGLFCGDFAGMLRFSRGALLRDAGRREQIGRSAEQGNVRGTKVRVRSFAASECRLFSMWRGLRPAARTSATDKYRNPKQARCAIRRWSLLFLPQRPPGKPPGGIGRKMRGAAGRRGAIPSEKGGTLPTSTQRSRWRIFEWASAGSRFPGAQKCLREKRPHVFCSGPRPKRRAGRPAHRVIRREWFAQRRPVRQAKRNGIKHLTEFRFKMFSGFQA